MYMRRVWKDFKMENKGNYHDLYVQSNKYLLADLFQNFKNICHKIQKLDPGRFLIYWIGSLKKDKSRIRNINGD